MFYRLLIALALAGISYFLAQWFIPEEMPVVLYGASAGASLIGVAILFWSCLQSGFHVLKQYCILRFGTYRWDRSSAVSALGDELGGCAYYILARFSQG